MIVKREKVYIRKNGIYREKIYRKSWWLFGIIPIFINDEIIERY